MKRILYLAAILPSLALAQPAGNLDLTFNGTGFNVTNVGSSADKAFDLAILDNGKILVAGTTFANATGNDFLVLCYNSDGSLDQTFGNNGKITTDLNLGSDDQAIELAVLSDGSFILAGFSDNGTDKDAALVKYNADGSLFTGFGSNGISITDLDGNNQDMFSCVKVHQLSGKIIAGGSSQIDDNHAKPVVARFNADGTLDNTFNTTGIRLMWVTNLDNQYLYGIEDLAVASNGKITAIGWRDFPNLSWDSDMVAFKINSDGSMDDTFSTDGEETYNGNFNGHDQWYAMLLNPDQTFIVVGRSYVSNLSYQGILAEVGTSGSINSTRVTGIDDNGYSDIAWDMNGDIVTCGYSGNSGLVTRMSGSNYSFDNSFGTSGMNDFNFNQTNEVVFYGIAVQSDNKIVVVGWKDNDVVIARLTGEGSPQLDDFNLQTPANNASNVAINSVSFNWTDAFMASEYQFQLASDINFSNILVDATTATSTYTYSTPLSLNTDYWWRVRSSDGTTYGAWKSPFKFKTVTGVGMDDLVLEGVLVFPNPSNDRVNVQFNKVMDVQVQLLNSVGQLVYQSQEVGISELGIPVAGLSNGIYTLTINGKEGISQQKVSILH